MLQSVVNFLCNPFTCEFSTSKGSPFSAFLCCAAAAAWAATIAVAIVVVQWGLDKLGCVVHKGALQAREASSQSVCQCRPGQSREGLGGLRQPGSNWGCCQALAWGCCQTLAWVRWKRVRWQARVACWGSALRGTPDSVELQAAPGPQAQPEALSAGSNRFCVNRRREGGHRGSQRLAAALQRRERGRRRGGGWGGLRQCAGAGG